MRILIAGCGYVGSALGHRLAREGHTVWGLRRDPANLPAGIHPLAADLADPASLEHLPPVLEGVFYTAGADGSTDAAYRKAYVEGIQNLLTALRFQQQEPRRVVFTSSTAVYGQSAGERVDESSPTEPRSFAGRRVLEGERALLGSEFVTSVVRLGGIYGPGRERLVQQVRSGGSGVPGRSARVLEPDPSGRLRGDPGSPPRFAACGCSVCRRRP